jgi:hypothetical protein
MTVVGNYSQPTGVLNIGIGGPTPGTEYDQLNITGTTGAPTPLDSGQADLGGTLNITLVNGSVPSVGDTFQIINYNPFVGDFQTSNGLEFGPSDQYCFIVTYNSTNVTLTVANAPAGSAPSISSLSTGSGTTAGGTAVTLTGSGFAAASAVSFGTGPADDFEVVSDGLVFASAPSQAAGTGDVQVTNPAGTSNPVSADRFTDTAASLSSISSVSLSSGSTSGNATVTLTVNFGGVAATSFTVTSDTSLTAVAPPQTAATVDLTVTTFAGTSATSSSDQFTSTAALALAVLGLGLARARAGLRPRSPPPRPHRCRHFFPNCASGFGPVWCLLLSGVSPARGRNDGGRTEQAAAMPPGPPCREVAGVAERARTAGIPQR